MIIQSLLRSIGFIFFIYFGRFNWNRFIKFFHRYYFARFISRCSTVSSCPPEISIAAACCTGLIQFSRCLLLVRAAHAELPAFLKDARSETSIVDDERSNKELSDRLQNYPWNYSNCWLFQSPRYLPSEVMRVHVASFPARNEGRNDRRSRNEGERSASHRDAEAGRILPRFSRESESESG